MSILEQVRQRLEELRRESQSLYEQRGALIDTAAQEKRGFTDDEQTRFDDLGEQRAAVDKQIGPLEERETELVEQGKREAAAAETRRMAGTVEGTAKVTDPPIYVKDGSTGNSFFRDVAHAQAFGDRDAADRLHRNNRMGLESRALGNTNAAGGSGGEFAPPDWILSEWINIIRAGRVLPDLYRKMDIPPGVSSINLPKITGGTTTALQSTQNTALSQTDMTTSYVKTGWATVGGKQVVSQQLLDQSGVNFDQIILNDLAADYALRVGTLAYTGAGDGTTTNSVVNGLGAATIGTTTTWTQASPTAALFFSQMAKTLQAFLAARLAPPSCWVMHPRRWYWLVSSTDSSGRPLVVPVGPAFNQLAEQTNAAVPAGMVGYAHGVPVYIDPLVPTNVGAGTNQDNVYLLRADDLILFESAPRSEAFRETYADSVGVLIRLYAYVGTMLNRHSESLAVITGTGLVPPTFPG